MNLGPDHLQDDSAGQRLEIDLQSRPCGSYGPMRFDVPALPLGKLKEVLRTFLIPFGDVYAASMLLVSMPEWGEYPRITVVLSTQRDLNSVHAAWRAEQPEAPSVWFTRLGDHPISVFAREFTIPFFDRETAALPAPWESTELAAFVQSLPDVPSLEATSEYLETLKESYNDLPPGEAAVEYQTQDREKEHTLAALRRKATHGEAKQIILRCLTEPLPYSLLLRTFDRELIAGTSHLTGGLSRSWDLDRPLERHIARVTPLDLVGIANPLDPFPPSDYALLEVGDDWLTVVVSLVAHAAAIFLVCDRLSAGISQELLAVQTMAREDDTFIILPTADDPDSAASMHLIDPNSTKGGFDPGYLRRKLATFGTTATAEEFMKSAPFEGIRTRSEST